MGFGFDRQGLNLAPSDYPLSAIRYPLIRNLEPTTGIEPVTSSLPRTCSTD